MDAPPPRGPAEGGEPRLTARHEQVADVLRRLIAAGTLPAGQRLPPETHLSVEYGVSTPTLREALEVLRAEGLIAKFQGRGNFVRRPPERITYPGHLKGARTKVSSTGTTATGHLAGRLGLAEGAPLTEYACLTGIGDAPQVLVHLYVPRTATPLTTASPWGDDLVIATGASVKTSNDQVTARFPTTAEAQSLRIGTRMPVLAIERTFTTADGQPAAYALLVIPGDRATVALVTPIDTDQEARQ
jgi:GntR family transcriptional regulator